MCHNAPNDVSYKSAESYNDWLNDDSRRWTEIYRLIKNKT